MQGGTTSSGFEFKVDDEALDDYLLLKDLSAISKGNSGKVTDVIERFLGADQEKKLMGHISKNNNGRVPASEMIKEVKEMFEVLKGKN